MMGLGKCISGFMSMAVKILGISGLDFRVCMVYLPTLIVDSYDKLVGKYMDVSKNSGTPKWMVYNGKPYENGWFGGTHIFGNTHISVPWIQLSGVVGSRFNQLTTPSARFRALWGALVVVSQNLELATSGPVISTLPGNREIYILARK